jgi:diguanylate cyclase (GGDEF)-like protein
VLTVAVFFTGMDNLNLLNLAIPSHYLLLIGSAVESFLLAGVIAMNAGEKSRELVLIQQKALEIEREARAAQEETLQIQHETRQELEYKVQERTLELQIALRELSETNSELEKLNTFDALTGIRNRGYFDKKFQAEARLSRREHTNLCLIMLDIDHFKAINNTFGHIAGDKCIQFVAEILRSNINRPRDEAFRYGGEEFAVLLPNTSIKGAKSIAEEIRHQVEHTEVSTSEGSVSMTISAGVSSGIIIGIDQEALLLEQADKALYEAKHSGRNKVCLFNADTADT